MRTRSAERDQGTGGAPTRKDLSDSVRIAFGGALLGIMSVGAGAFVVDSVLSYVFAGQQNGFLLDGIGITWPIGVPLVGLAAATGIIAVWRMWHLDSLGMAIVSGLVWMVVGVGQLIASGNWDLLLTTGFIVALLASAGWARRTPGSGVLDLLRA